MLDQTYVNGTNLHSEYRPTLCPFTRHDGERKTNTCVPADDSGFHTLRGLGQHKTCS